jgi:hypothetical protein
VPSIVRFHKQGGDGDPHNDILMNRNNQILTNSISCVQISPGKAEFHYLDLRNGQSADYSMPLQKTIPENA